MKESDPLAYMRNINTSPGPNAGRSIDPTQPGPPDADRAPNPAGVYGTAQSPTMRDLKPSPSPSPPQDFDAATVAPSADVDRLNLLERYVASVAMWMDRENVTDQERLSYIKGHPVTRAALASTRQESKRLLIARPR